MQQKKKWCAPNIGSNYVDALDHRPEDGCTNLGMRREANGNERAAGAEIVNRLLVCSALYVEVLWIAIRCPIDPRTHAGRRNKCCMWAFSTCRVFDILHNILRLTEVDPLLRSELQA